MSFDRDLVTVGAVGARAPTRFQKLGIKHVIKGKIMDFRGNFWEISVCACKISSLKLRDNLFSTIEIKFKDFS